MCIAERLEHSRASSNASVYVEKASVALRVPVSMLVQSACMCLVQVQVVLQGW